jgi:phosphatidylethanolamine N-methyltransferase
VTDPLFWYCVATVVGAPLIWNILGRTEYYHGWLRGLLGKPIYAVLALAAWIISFSLYRDYLFHQVVQTQPKHPVILQSFLLSRLLAGALIAGGQTFVLSSYYRLGFAGQFRLFSGCKRWSSLEALGGVHVMTGTFLGDYCSILMEARVTAFPFSVLDNPMYVGSTMTFFGTALWSVTPLAPRPCPCPYSPPLAEASLRTRWALNRVCVYGR